MHLNRIVNNFNFKFMSIKQTIPFQLVCLRLNPAYSESIHNQLCVIISRYSGLILWVNLHLCRYNCIPTYLLLQVVSSPSSPHIIAYFALLSISSPILTLRDGNNFHRLVYVTFI